MFGIRLFCYTKNNVLPSSFYAICFTFSCHVLMLCDCSMFFDQRITIFQGIRCYNNQNVSVTVNCFCASNYMLILFGCLFFLLNNDIICCFVHSMSVYFCLDSLEQIANRHSSVVFVLLLLLCICLLILT